MYITVTESQFIREFESSQWRDSFSHAELCCIFAYLDAEDIELDVGSIACAFTSAHVHDVIPDYDLGIEVSDPLEVTTEQLAEVTAWLSKHTIVLDCGSPSRVLYGAF
jgi:uncharacterized cysteine cluster protein YcgN (CxxCxxCC family)